MFTDNCTHNLLQGVSAGRSLESKVQPAAAARQRGESLKSGGVEKSTRFRVASARQEVERGNQGEG